MTSKRLVYFDSDGASDYNVIHEEEQTLCNRLKLKSAIVQK